jgi:hypothetical protein
MPVKPIAVVSNITDGSFNLCATFEMNMHSDSLEYISAIVEFVLSTARAYEGNINGYVVRQSLTRPSYVVELVIRKEH